MLSIVDAHHHLHDLRTHYYPWLSGDVESADIFGDHPERLRTDYLIDDFLADSRASNVVKSVHIQNGWDPRDPVGETRWLQAIADRYAFPHAIVAYAALEADDVAMTLDEHSRSANVRGIRQILNWDPDPKKRFIQYPALMTSSAWRRGFAQLARHGFSFDLQIYFPQMKDAYDLALAFSKTPIILNHAGMPLDRSPEAMAGWERAMRCLAKAENISVKISGLALGQRGWSVETIRPLVLKTIDIFGIHRSMFASNFPVDGLFSAYAALFDAFKAVTSDFSAAERDALFRTNAERIYRI